jgi:hypothetical protein
LFWPVYMGTQDFCASNCVSTVLEDVGSDSNTWYPQYKNYEDKRLDSCSPTDEIKSMTHLSVTKTYHLLGDSSSVGAVTGVLISNCSIEDTKGSIASCEPDSPNWLVKPEQVIRIHASC